MYDNVDWYEVLEVSPEASEAEIELAWRYKVYEAHPDRNASTDAHERTKLLNMARDTLLDKNRRRKFDWQRAERKRQEEAQRQERARRQKEKKQGKIDRVQVLEAILGVERKRRIQAEQKLRDAGWHQLRVELQMERKRREQAERKLRFKEEFNSDYRHLYDKEKLRAEQAEARATQEQQRAANAERRVDDLEALLDDLHRDLGIQVYETQPYRRPYSPYDSERERTVAWRNTPFSKL